MNMRNYKVIDSFLFNGEYEMLNMRLDYYSDVVDYFFISESDYTQAGQKKELTYPKIKHLFDKYKDKIVYSVFTPTQEDIEMRKEDRFYVEKKHIDSMKEGLVKISDDDTMIMLSGVDEFPKKELFDKFRELTKDLILDEISCKMKTLYYSPLCEIVTDVYETNITNNYTLNNIKNFSDLRWYGFNCKHVENAGWHLSFFQTPEEIQKKIQTYSHSEFNKPEIIDINNIKYKMYNSLDVLDRDTVRAIKIDKISDEFPIEFYRHEIFFRNTFDRVYLKNGQVMRKNEAMQIPLEIENLQLYVANKKPKVIVEIGTARGGTLARWFEIPSVETIISIDYPVGIHGGQGFEERVYVISDALEQSNLTNKEFYAVNGNSKDPYLINRVDELLNGRKIDFLFIDGDHTYEGVKSDFQLYEKFLKEDSVVGFHDILDSNYHAYANCFVSKFWEEIKEKYNFEEFISTNLIDKKISGFAHTLENNGGGFGGIGVVEYGKKKVLNEPISIIIPVYNNANLTIEYLNKTLETSNFVDEILLLSNGSSDEENEILLNFVSDKNNIKLYIIDKQLGFVKAVNELIKKTKNELILCLNSDLYLYDNWENILINLCNIENNGLIGPVLFDDFVLGCCFVMKKSIINKVGMLNEGFGLGYYDDNELSYRIKRNGYDLGFYSYSSSHSKDSETLYVDFPMYHIQGCSFMHVSCEKEKKMNELKWNNLKNCEKMIVMKDFDYDEIKSKLKDFTEDDVIVVINKSGENFEKIRFDEDIIYRTHIYECTPEMNIDELIISVSKGKKVEILETKKNTKLTWLAKFDDYASMGILSQRIIEKLNCDVSCQPIIGNTDTKNPIILRNIEKPNNSELGIMFSYPDMYSLLNNYKTKIIYTGVDTTGGIPKFAENINKVDFILTPSTISKERMESLGVKKPIFVFPHGIDPKVFKYTERTKSNVFKFLYVGECSDRKGIFQLLDAFISEFKNNENVELHIKSNNDMLFYGGDKIKEIMNSHKNIYWHTGNEGHDYVLELYRSCHAYVYPSRADTFGMTLLEAMACGLPVITTGEPGATELIEGKYFHIPTKDVPVKGHPWMLGEWGEPNVEILKMSMKQIYQRYDYVVSPTKLKEYSDFVCENYSWDKVVSRFESEILPQLKKKTKVLTLLTSYNRPHHIKNIISSLKDIREDNVINDVYIVENSNTELKEECVRIINENIDDRFTLYVSDINLGQRGALLQMLEDVNIDDYDFIQFTDQDNIFNEPISTYCNILIENPDICFTTGYMSKEHPELGWRKTKYGNLCEKTTIRAGHMFMRSSYIKSLLPIHLDSQFGEKHNSSWYGGLDWEITHWNSNAVGRHRYGEKFVLCVPGGVLHKGVDSTFSDWPVEENEYSLEELNKLRSV